MSVPTISPLLRHPGAPCSGPDRLEVTATHLADGGLILYYRLFGRPELIRTPAQKPPGPADGLWQHTCCEAFVAEAGTAYREFNFSPSGQWASYRFTDYRKRDEVYAPAAQPHLAFSLLPDGFALQATIPATLLPVDERPDLGLTAIIEAADGSKSYWALTHCAAQPDFHLRQSFTLALNRPAP
ncbi:DOMON-like domain-containing protein [Dechloromonas sp. HYN0024]|uniref:DOMON-like domain-containing protein n=1 Tax=Dechloromonas sp. HYN0024 TaxID=2231055 RepID=UPI000E43472E|nr:DOMON-like domain-containing protein [Dechloromonas sp. HYN0024]AXS80977.1 hypothetical protein HYN24_13660 [Dechloromonas sp. HYN0024]